MEFPAPIPQDPAERRALHDSAVAAGMAYLDETTPDWRGRVDVTKLDLTAAGRCTLAQVDRICFPVAARDRRLTTEDRERLGFSLPRAWLDALFWASPTRPGAFLPLAAELTAAWLDALAAEPVPD